MVSRQERDVRGGRGKVYRNGECLADVRYDVAFFQGDIVGQLSRARKYRGVTDMTGTLRRIRGSEELPADETLTLELQDGVAIEFTVTGARDIAGQTVWRVQGGAHRRGVTEREGSIAPRQPAS
ncbi:MAG: hypothetical protein ACOC5M_01990 [Chloroflexota bacterium]